MCQPPLDVPSVHLRENAPDELRYRRCSSLGGNSVLQMCSASLRAERNAGASVLSTHWDWATSKRGTRRDLVKWSSSSGWVAVFAFSVTLPSAFAGQSGWFWQNPLPQGSSLHGVAQLGSMTAVAVGGGGIILRTEDGGVTWSLRASGTTRTLRAISFGDANTGFAVGAAGTILRTDDGGETWGAQTTGSSNLLNGVSFVNPSVGTAVGERGTILRTEDGGATWTP